MAEVNDGRNSGFSVLLKGTLTCGQEPPTLLSPPLNIQHVSPVADALLVAGRTLSE